MNLPRVINFCLFCLSCGPAGTPTLEVRISPRKPTSTSTKISVVAQAANADGTVGVGVVRLKSSAGSLVDGVDVALDSFGQATAPLRCDPPVTVECTNDIRVTARWTPMGRSELTADDSIAQAFGGPGVVAYGDGGVQTPACDGSVLVGKWRRTDGFEFVFSGQACGMNATGTSDHTHLLEGTFNPSSRTLPFSIRRTSLQTGCVTRMSGSLQLTDNTRFQLTLTGTDGACDLPMTYAQVQQYQKV
jgi:hypothetical protein